MVRVFKWGLPDLHRGAFGSKTGKH